MIYNKVLADVQSAVGREYLHMQDIEDNIEGVKTQQNFLDYNKGYVVYYRFPINSFLSGFQDRYQDIFSKIKAFQTMNDHIIFTYKGSIIFRIVINRQSSFPYRGILCYGKKPKVRFTTTNLSMCVKLVTLYMYKNKMIDYDNEERLR